MKVIQNFCEIKRNPDGDFVRDYLLFINWCGCLNGLLLTVNIKAMAKG